MASTTAHHGPRAQGDGEKRLLGTRPAGATAQANNSVILPRAADIAHDVLVVSVIDLIDVFIVLLHIAFN